MTGVEMELFEINNKILTIKQLQNTAVESLHDVTQTVSSNNIIPQQKIIGLTDSLTLLVNAQNELIGDLKSFMGDGLSESAIARHYRTMLGDGSADNLFVTKDFEKFLSITSDNADFKDAIVKFQNEIKSGVLVPAKDGFFVGIVSMINKAVESQEEFLKLKTTLFEELKQRHLMIYLGLSEHGYRFGEVKTETQNPTETLAEVQSDAPATESVCETEPAARPATGSVCETELTVVDAEEESGEDSAAIPVGWEGNSAKIAIKKCLGDFLERDSRTGKWYKTQHFGKIKRLEDLHYLGLITQETFEQIIGKPTFDWLFTKGYIARTVAPVGGFNVISLSNKGAAILNNDTVKIMSYGRSGAKDKQILLSACEYYKDETEAGILQITAVGETAAALMSASQYPYNTTINFAYKYIVLKFRIEDKEYGIGLCTEEKMSEDGFDALTATLTGLDSDAVIECKLLRTEEGGYTGEIAAVNADGKPGFTFKISGSLDGAAEYLKAFFSGEDLTADNLPADGGDKNQTEEEVDEEPPVEEPAEAETADADDFEEVENEAEEEAAIADTATIEEKSEEVAEEQLYEIKKAQTEEAPKAYDAGSVEALCENIAANGLTPKENAAEFYAVAMKLIAENRMWDAIFFLKNVAYGSEEFKGLADNLKYIATVHKWDSISYSELENYQFSQELEKYPFVLDALKLARSLHCLAFFENNDYICAPNARAVKCETLAVPSLISTCKALLNELSILSKQSINEGGYKEAEISATVNAQAAISEFKKRADSLIAHPYKGKLEPLIKPTFLKDKPLIDCLSAVKYNDASAYENVKSIMIEHFNKTDGNSFVADKDKIENYIDKIWEIAKKLDPDKKHDTLKSDARTQSIEYLSERVDFINEWLAFCNTKLYGQSLKVAHRIQIIELAKAICNTCIIDVKEIIAANIIKFAAQRISGFLSGEFFNKEWFAPVLCTNEFLLTNSFLPEDLSCFATVKGLEPWRSAVRHFSVHRATKESALEDILTQKNNFLIGNNTSHKLLCDCLKIKFDPLIETGKIKPQAELERKKFEARMETDFLYNRIDETEKENFFAAERVLFDYMTEKHSELGKYKKFLGILTAQVDDIVRVKSAEFKKQITELEKQYPDAPILENIKSELNKNNFIVVEEYITRLQSGEKEIEQAQAEQEEGNSVLKTFLELYDEIYKFANSPKNKMTDFTKWAKAGYSEFNGKLGLSPSPSDVRETEQYFEAWKGDGKSIAEKFISQLGYTVEKTTAAKSLEFCDDCFTVKVKPIPLTRASYAHPIGAFGTECKSINVLCFYGDNKADRVVKAVEELNPRGTATVVLFNAALNKNRREQILKEFKSKSRLNSFLLVDYVLGFYLALAGKGRRLNALLQCSVPYTGYKLFSDSVDTLLPEMFIGREQEINKITALDDPVTLVYGGRQLGKTALFRRACAMMNNPDEGQYAIYVSVARAETDDDNFFVRRLSEELVRCRIIEKRDYESNDDICKALGEKVSRNDTEYLYLFIDEVNDYFEQLNKRKDTTALNPFIDLKRKSSKKFKFVLAGLHHVERYSEFYKDNSGVGQMPVPMLVKPLSRMEAIRLIDYPFSYLGINIDQSFTALIAARANYYPGNIQMICQKIVETVQSGTNKPPYTVDDKLLETVCGSSEINKEIRKKIDITLGLDPAYKAIAMLFVYKYYEDKETDGITVGGYSSNQILEMAKEWERKEVSDLSLRELETLLDELTNMSILRTLENKDDRAIKTYKLRKSSLAEQIATKDEVTNYLLGD